MTECCAPICSTEGTAPLAEAATVLSRIEAGQTTGTWVLLHPVG